MPINKPAKPRARSAVRSLRSVSAAALHQEGANYATGRRASHVRPRNRDPLLGDVVSRWPPSIASTVVYNKVLRVCVCVRIYRVVDKALSLFL